MLTRFFYIEKCLRSGY